MAFNISYNIIAVDKFSRVNNQISRSVDKLNSKIQKTSQSFKDFGAKFSTRVTLPIAGFGAIALKNAAEVESFQVRLSVLLKSTEKARDLMKDLTDFTARTPFQLPGVVKTASQLLAFGFESENIVETLRVLGDAAAGSGSSLGEIGLIFGQISAAGKLTGERFLQLAERGIPIAKSLSQITGVAEQKIPDAISKGLIKFELVQEAFKNMTKQGGVFFKATEKQSKTLSGLFSTLKDNIFLSLASIGQTLVETFDLKDKVNALIASIGSLTNKFNNFVKNNPKLTKFLFTLTAVVAIIPPLALAIGIFGSALSAVIGAISSGIAIMGGFVSVLAVVGPAAISAGISIMTGLVSVIGIVVGAVGAIPVAIGAAVIALGILFIKVKKVRDIFFSAIDAIKRFFQAIARSKIATAITGGIGKGVEFLKSQEALQTGRLSEIAISPVGDNSAISRSDINLNINAPEGVVQSVRSKSNGPTNFNIGQNARLATSGAF